MLKKIKKTKKIKNNFISKQVSKKILKSTAKIKNKYILEMYSGDNYITNSVIKKKKYFKILSIEKNKKNILNIFFFNKILKIKKNKFKHEIKKINKKKKHNIILNPPYLKYHNINIKKILYEPLKSLTKFKKKNIIKKEIKYLKKFLKKKSKIIIENNNYEKICK